jgi:hypothetical protein
MRAIILAAIVAASIGLVGTAGASAAPANGVTINDSATVASTVVKAHWNGRSRWWRRGPGGCHYRGYSWGRCW